LEKEKLYDKFLALIS